MCHSPDILELLPPDAGSSYKAYAYDSSCSSSGSSVEFRYLTDKWLPSHVLDKDVLLDA